MAYYNDIAGRSDLIERLLSNASRTLKNTADRLATHRVYKTTLAEMQVLSDRELADLGLHRSELKRIAWDAATAR